ncbi:TOBE domain-containing protein [Halobacterium zhouii]|uniref:TOBE domain-containing protein n=1 Tax=Halobacterium zhouii TaxID=2902624 RepID=UPI001E45068E|nr:TOBE domain-containing protein [Halobacterium zhouii]
MALSARTRLTGEVASIEREELVAEVVVDLPRGGKVTSIVTMSSVKRLGLTVGEPVDVVVKATDVMIDSEATDETVAEEGTEDMGETDRSSGSDESGTETTEHESERISGTDASAGPDVGEPGKGPDVGVNDPEEGRNREN